MLKFKERKLQDEGGEGIYKTVVEVRGESAARLPTSSEPCHSCFPFSDDNSGSNFNR